MHSSHRIYTIKTQYGKNRTLLLQYSLPKLWYNNNNNTQIEHINRNKIIDIHKMLDWLACELLIFSSYLYIFFSTDSIYIFLFLYFFIIYIFFFSTVSV